ncbi:MAG: hypothetical protein NC344_11605 [Bacteroidales bacterium]|nr:hypothetical protein [Bacteroidales bacterium]MCM1148449.1 hypothetical protein [Bacteroidales bacterium]MCM1207266.1 hypothetical protein [Bacillota bacterium]MCM1511473.1 hypothetical protein [Clostridium sp.]
MEEMLCRRLKNVCFCTLDDISKKTLSEKIDNIDVWGWDLSVVNQLVKAGASTELMPSESVLDKLRAVSDRATSTKLLEFLIGNLERVCGDAVAVYNINNVDEFSEKWGDILLKSPWSSSGRGVRKWDGSCYGTRRWVEKTIETQGHIMVERHLDKVLDFAMEFSAADDGTVKYEGLSLFDTVGGAYVGNLLAPEYEKKAILSSYVSPQLLHDVADIICRWMEHALSGNYAGPFGVDMMIVRSKDDNGFLLNPCVEINLRRTMGHVALSLSDSEMVIGKVMRVFYENGKYHFRIESKNS